MGNYSSALSGGGGDVSSGALKASLIGRTVSAARVEAAHDSATTTLLYRPAGGAGGGQEIGVELTEALELVAQGEIVAGRYTPAGRAGTPEEVGHVAVFLASEEASYVTGQLIVVDGGNTIQEYKVALD